MTAALLRIALSAAIGAAALWLLSVLVGVPLRWGGSVLLVSAAFVGAGLAAGTLVGGLTGWTGLLAGLILGLGLVGQWPQSESAAGQIVGAAVMLGYYGWALLAGSIGFLVGALIRRLRSSANRPPGGSDAP